MMQAQSTEAFISAAQQGDRQALEQLVIQNSGLVYSVLKRFLNRGQSQEDLYQIGCIGLIKAVKRFDVSHGLRFSTYAVALIAGEIKQFFRDDGMVKVSRDWKITACRAAAARQEWEKKTGRELTISELADQMQVEAEELILAMDACKSPDSLDIPPQDGGVLLPGEPFPLNELVDRIAVQDAVAKLGEQEQKIIMLRYFRQKSQKETGDILGLSQPHVSRVEKKILKKLKEIL